MKLERQTFRGLKTEGAALGLTRALELEGPVKLTRSFDEASQTYTVEAVLPYERDADAAYAKAAAE